MRKTVLAACAILTLFAILALPLTAAAEGSWEGWITDEKCGAAGANAEHKECALKCHEGGEALVLYNTDDEKLYKLSDQEMAKANLGYPVVVTGTLEGDTITVASIAEQE